MEANTNSALLRRARSRVKDLLHRAGYDVSLFRDAAGFGLRVDRLEQDVPARPLAPLFDHVLDALHHMRGEKAAAFRCPVAACVTANGFSFSPQGWHPFSAALDAYRCTGSARYEGSLLERYYASWRPRNAREALLDRDAGPARFESLPSYCMFLFPWLARSIDEAEGMIRKWTTDDAIQHGVPAFADIERHGIKDHGPVSPEAGAFELARLISIYRTLEAEDFRREYGDVRVVAIVRDGDFRFLNYGGGLHRTAAMKALGRETIPARLLRPFVFDVADVQHWPQVRAGVWDAASARRYVDHLFDFDSLRWAQQRGLA